MFEEQRKRITSISGYQSIITHGAFYTDPMMDRLPQLDSNRKDMVYEEFKGHKLDRKMLELLRNDR